MSYGSCSIIKTSDFVNRDFKARVAKFSKFDNSKHSITKKGYKSQELVTLFYVNLSKKCLL